MPCPQHLWCHYLEVFWAASIINDKTRKLFYDEKAGFILNPNGPEILCACQGDCNSMSAPKGHRGCNPRKCCDKEECGRIDHDCSYPPSELGEALAAQQRRNVPYWNEVVLDPYSVRDHLPGSIQAFFYMGSDSFSIARRIHAKFLQEFRLTAAQVPLLKLSLQGLNPLRCGGIGLCA